eukprot:TRINITY_DN5596_c0_g1_i3.p1 TRINITY_DN5596_c0_g1~~TRINITY_DN5596_c0_g1_i3.p1  ORF type:complete len:421 (-),score=73.12 TRINITY_DN5596_c0_g1_i3:37-1299(-)
MLLFTGAPQLPISALRRLRISGTVDPHPALAWTLASEAQIQARWPPGSNLPEQASAPNILFSSSNIFLHFSLSQTSCLSALHTLAPAAVVVDQQKISIRACVLHLRVSQHISISEIMGVTCPTRSSVLVSLTNHRFLCLHMEPPDLSPDSVPPENARKTEIKVASLFKALQDARFGFALRSLAGFDIFSPENTLGSHNDPALLHNRAPLFFAAPQREEAPAPRIPASMICVSLLELASGITQALSMHTMGDGQTVFARRGVSVDALQNSGQKPRSRTPSTGSHSGKPPSETDALESVANERTYVFQVLSGQCCVVIHDPSSPLPFLLAQVSTGEVFGHGALLFAEFSAKSPDAKQIEQPFLPSPVPAGAAVEVRAVGPVTLLALNVSLAIKSAPKILPHLVFSFATDLLATSTSFRVLLL